MKDEAIKWMYFWWGVVLGCGPWAFKAQGWAGLSGVVITSALMGVWLLRGWRERKCANCGHLRGDHSPAGCLVRDHASTLGFCRCENDGG